MVREAPEQSYRPQARVRLIVRFEDFGAGDTPTPPKLPPQLRKGGKPGPDDLRVVARDGRLVLDGAGRPGGPQKQISSSDGRTQPIDLIPKSVTYCLNGIRQADTATVEISFADFPVDPRLVLACAVEIYFGSVRADDFAAGATAGGARSGEDSRPSRSVLPESWTDSRGRRRSNLRFMGWADDIELERGEDGEPVVRFECTDNTRLLLDQDAPAQLQLQKGVEIDRAIAEYLAAFPQFAGLEVEYRPAGQPKPVLTAADLPGAPKGAGAKPTLAPTADGQQGPPPTGASSEKVLDYLTDVCGMLGHIVFVEGVTVVVQRPRTLYGSDFRGREGDPFTGRTLPSGRVLRSRTLVYGRNVVADSYRRKLTKFSAQNIEVRCFDPRSKHVLKARFPREGDRQKKLLPGNAADQAWQTYYVQGIEDQATLDAVAQGFYESIGRQEMEVTVRTENLASYGGGADDPDLLDAQAGDDFEVVTNRASGDDDSSTAERVEDVVSSPRAAAFLVQLGFPKLFAQEYARAARSLAFPTRFRLRQAQVSWKEDDATEIELTLVNYVEARANAKLPPGEEPEPDPTAGSPDRVVVAEWPPGRD